MKKFVGFAAACALLCAASSASAITYVANRAVGQGFVNLSITTDDTLGVLSTSNIIDWLVLIDDGVGPGILKGPAAYLSWVGVSGSSLTATSTDLYFDFNQPGYFIFVNAQTSDRFCFQSGICSDAQFTSSGELLRVGGGATAGYAFQAYSGNQIIASVAGGAVPEPGAWALMLAGFGLAGSALRARRRTLAA